MITDHHNYDNGYIALVDLELANLPDQITVGNKILLKKSEFHISIMAIKNLAPLLNPDNVEAAAKQLKDDFVEFAKTHDLTQFSLTNEFRHVKRDERETVVAMVKLENLDALFSHLQQKYGIEFPLQPAHITLYTLQAEAGIGILSYAELERDSVQIQLPAFTS